MNCPMRVQQLLTFHSFQIRKWMDCVSCLPFSGICHGVAGIFIRLLHIRAHCVCWLRLGSFCFIGFFFVGRQLCPLELSLWNFCRSKISPLLLCFLSLITQCKLIHPSPPEPKVRTDILLYSRILVLITSFSFLLMETHKFYRLFEQRRPRWSDT